MSTQKIKITMYCGDISLTFDVANNFVNSMRTNYACSEDAKNCFAFSTKNDLYKCVNAINKS